MKPITLEGNFVVLEQEVYDALVAAAKTDDAEIAKYQDADKQMMLDVLSVIEPVLYHDNRYCQADSRGFQERGYELAKIFSKILGRKVFDDIDEASIETPSMFAARTPNWNDHINQVIPKHLYKYLPIGALVSVNWFDPETIELYSIRFASGRRYLKHVDSEHEIPLPYFDRNKLTLVQLFEDIEDVESLD